ncbi:RnfABCDGE type electron transport complex subunit G [Clostridium thailandense]|uniref:RnfABCDGE type electron transport complex subunit G n=1 Tax=Clostridium thailandense TaxID=2794346 RepID=UPI003988BE26
MKDKEIIKLGLILLIIASVAGFILAGAYSVTKAPIEKQNIKTNKEAMKELITTAEDFKRVQGVEENNVLEVNEAIANSKTIGYTIKVSTKGYSGEIQTMVGISTKGEVTGIKILSQTETPGLGANAVQPKFSGQYKNKPIENALEVVKRAVSKPNEIEAMTGATITSKAVTDGVNEAVDFYKNKLKGGQK